MEKEKQKKLEKEQKQREAEEARVAKEQAEKEAEEELKRDKEDYQKGPRVPRKSRFVSLPFSKRQILSFTELKTFDNDNFKFDENGGKFSKRVKNTLGKLLVTSNFSFSHSVFKRLVVQICKNQGLFGNRLRC